MKTKIMGKKITKIYYLDDGKERRPNEDGFWFARKPELKFDMQIDGWETICEFEGELHYNNNEIWISNSVSPYFQLKINISEDEEALVEKTIFRADLNEMHVHTNKVISENNVNKEETEERYEGTLCVFNCFMIESDDKLKQYCNLHKLRPADIDCIELFKLVYQQDNYAIVDGKFQTPQMTWKLNSTEASAIALKSSKTNLITTTGLF